MKLGIITFAGERLGCGTGHLMESLLIASEWQTRKTAKIRVFLNNFIYGLERVKEAGLSFEVYCEDSYSQHPFKKVPQMVSDWGYDVVLVNVPALFKEEIEWLSGRLSPMVVILDNDQNQSFSVSALINYNINQEPKFYTSREVPCYTGIDYVPLNQQRLEQAKLTNSEKFREGDIVITFGGTNPNRLALKVVQALFANEAQSRVSLVLGGGTPQSMYREITAWLKKHPMPCNLYYNLSQGDFYELIAKSSCAISAPGNTLYELGYLGIPTAAIAENGQTLRIAEKFAQKRWCINLGLGTKLSLADLTFLLQKFLSNLPETQTCPVDGRGVERIISIIENIIADSRYSMRSL